MKQPALFFDRDNTLIVGSDYLGDPDDVVLMPGAADAISRARALGFATVVVSNQSGVARGMFAEADVRAVNARMDDYLLEENPAAVIDRHEFCPFHPDGTVERYKRESDLRKPKPGMILKVADLLKIDLTRSWLIGDAPRDIEAGQAAGLRTILFQPPGVTPSPAALQATKTQPTFTCSSLKEAIDYIARHQNDATLSLSQSALATSSASPAGSGPSTITKATSVAIDAGNVQRLERLAEQILEELKRRNQHSTDFSVSKLLGGITQILSIAVLFVAYINRFTDGLFPLLFTAIFFQLLTISLLIMDRQR